MNQSNFKTTIGVVVLVLIIGIAAVAFMWKPQTSQENTAPVQQTPSAQTPPTVEGSKVPEGWYAHKTYGMENEITVLSRTKELPNNPAIEQIAISNMTTSLVPEDFIPRQGLVGGNLDSPNADWSWGIYKGRKTFSMTVNSGDTQVWFVYIFGGQIVLEFTFSPNDSTNPNLEKDREDFWKVITYYVEQSSFEKLSRAETQQNCKTATLPEEQKRNMQVEPETGYVVINYTVDSKRKYVFLNYNDDLSQCAQNVKTFLENVKDSAEKLSQ